MTGWAHALGTEEQDVRKFVLGIAVPVLLSLSACGGGEEEAKGPDRGSDAASEQESPAAAGECSYDEKSLLPALRKAVPADATSKMTMKVSGPGVDVWAEGSMAYTSGGLEVELTMRDGKRRMSLVVVDDRAFLRDSAGGDYQELDSSHPATAELRREISGMTVTSSFDAFRAGLETVEVVGEEELDGEKVCHYTLGVDASEAMKAAGDPVPAGMPETIDYELFLTEDDLIRRITFDLGPVSTEMDATDWNEPLEIKVPQGF